MRTFDLAPLYRATVGFDQIADLMDRVLTETASTNTYPPYNIEKTADDGWRISIAVAGFAEGGAARAGWSAGVCAGCGRSGRAEATAVVRT